MDPIDWKLKAKAEEIEKVLGEWAFSAYGSEREIKRGDIKKWFGNFKPSEFEDAFLIFSNIKYYDDHQKRAFIEGLSKEIKKIFKENLSAVRFFPLGESIGSSGGIFLYDFRKELGLSEEAFPMCSFRDIAVAGVKSLVFFDDIIGSGNQAIRFARDYLKDIEIDKYYVALLGFEDGINKIEREGCFKKVVVHSRLSEENRAFSDVSEVFPETETRKRLEKMCRHYGQRLYPKHPLGYDDSQALIAFPHNTPNNTLPIIWASTRNEKKPGYPWNPLWERKKENRGRLSWSTNKEEIRKCRTC